MEGVVGHLFASRRSEKKRVPWSYVDSSKTTLTRSGVLLMNRQCSAVSFSFMGLEKFAVFAKTHRLVLLCAPRQTQVSCVQSAHRVGFHSHNDIRRPSSHSLEGYPTSGEESRSPVICFYMPERGLVVKDVATKCSMQTENSTCHRHPPERIGWSNHLTFARSDRSYQGITQPRAGTEERRKHLHDPPAPRNGSQ